MPGLKKSLRTLLIRNYLRENTNPDHYAKSEDIIEYLELYGITAERKSIYEDIYQLQLFGEAIEKIPGKSGGYYCDGTEFDLSEIKLLVDSVQSSKFLTEKQSVELINKIMKLTNKYDAKKLSREVYVRNRVKTAQDDVIRNIDYISEAIDTDKTVTFKYYQYNIHKKLEAKYDGKIYEVSPYCFIWDNENYYLLAYDAENGQMKHYRVDKIKKPGLTNNPRQGKDEYKKLDMSSYNKMVFSMYHGDMTKVKIRFDNSLIGVVLDKFGSDVTIVNEDDDHFLIYVDIAVSKQFYAWLFGFPGECEVIEPEWVREELHSIAKTVKNQYE